MSFSDHRFASGANRAYPFPLIMDELTVHIQVDVPLCMMFADDIVLMYESRDGVNAKLERWREAFESKGFNISHTETEYMDCNFSGHLQIAETMMRMKGQEIKRFILVPWLDN